MGASAVALLPGGKIVVAGGEGGSDGTRLAVARLHPNGSIDTNFGDQGIGRIDGLRGSASALLVQPDGRIIVGGKVFHPEAGDEGDLAVARFDKNGNVDSGFGNEGVALFNFGSSAGSSDSLASLALQRDGKIIVSGSIFDMPAPRSFRHAFGIVRLNPDGQLDANYGSAGAVIDDFDGLYNDVRLSDVVIQRDGKLLAVGQPDSHHLAIVRYNSDGSIDATFGEAGRVIRPGRFSRYDIALDGNEIVLAGCGYEGGGLYTGRYDWGGQLLSESITAPETSGSLQVSTGAVHIGSTGAVYTLGGAQPWYTPEEPTDREVDLLVRRYPGFSVASFAPQSEAGPMLFLVPASGLPFDEQSAPTSGQSRLASQEILDRDDEVKRLGAAGKFLKGGRYRVAMYDA